MKHVADLKTFLEERIAELKEEIETFQEELEMFEKALESIDAILVKESFKSAADLIKQPKEPKFKPLSEQIPVKKEKQEKSEKEEFQIKTKLGKILGLISVYGETISIVPEKGMEFSVNAPPYRSFFHKKIMTRMKNEDEAAIGAGKLPDSEKIVINLIQDDAENIKNIVIQNFRNYDRKMEIINTITWTFRTIYDEKTR